MKRNFSDSIVHGMLAIIVVTAFFTGCGDPEANIMKKRGNPDISELKMSDNLKQIYSDRRSRLMEKVGDGVILISSGGFPSGSHGEFRVEDNFFYLTGLDQPLTAIAISRDDKTRCTFFMMERSRRDIIYNGPSRGNDELKNDYGVDTIISYRDLPGIVRECLNDHKDIYIDYNDMMIKNLVMSEAEKQKMGKSNIKDITPALDEMRVFKDDHEISLMQKAINITGEAVKNACRICAPGMYEFEIEAMIEYTFRKNGCDGPAFTSIVGSGPNTVTLHYADNNRKMEDGDLLLMDIGAEYGYYAADITRTIPVNGKFTKEQKDIYNLVLKAQKAAINELKPGKPLYEGHRVATATIAHGLWELGLLTDTTSTWQKEFYTIYQISHYLGLNVHDPGDYGVSTATIRENRAVDTSLGRPLEKGMVLTAEPGLYLRKNGLDQIYETFGYMVGEEEIREFIYNVGPVYEKYENIGVRIEDDILITDTGNVVLSQGIPKEIAEIEKLMKGR